MSSGSITSAIAKWQMFRGSFAAGRLDRRLPPSQFGPVPGRRHESDDPAGEPVTGSRSEFPVRTGEIAGNVW